VTGYQVLERMPAAMRRRTIVLTAVSEKQRQAVNANHLHGLLRKPFELDELIDAVQTVGQPHILVVEDDEPTQYLVERAITHGGYRVTVAADGQKALQALENAHFDAIVVDLNLPHVSGYEVIEQALQRPGAPPIVVLTVLEEPEYPLDGIAAYLHKPEGFSTVVDAVRSLTHV
jgi:CheY-like chemotaxis protein